MLNSIEHQILNANLYKISRTSAFLGSDKLRMLERDRSHIKSLIKILVLKKDCFSCHSIQSFFFESLEDVYPRLLTYLKVTY